MTRRSEIEEKYEIWYKERPWISIKDGTPDFLYRFCKFKVKLADGRELWSWYEFDTKEWSCTQLNPKLIVTHFRRHSAWA